MIPAETNVPSDRVLHYNATGNHVSRAMALDELEEVREIAGIRQAAYKERMAKYFNRKVKPRSFQVGDLVLRIVANDRLDRTHGKLHPNWEGPYRVTKVIPGGAYRLAHLDGRCLDNPWNVANLRKYVDRTVNSITF